MTNVPACWRQALCAGDIQVHVDGAVTVLVEHSNGVFGPRLRCQLGQVALELLFPVLVDKSGECNTHTHAGMCADNFPSYIHFGIINLDYKRDYLADRQR